MKKSVFLAIILILLSFSVFLSGCDIEGTGKGTVIVYNDSKYPHLDAIIEVKIIETGNKNLADSGNCEIDSSITFKNIPTAKSYRVVVIDGSDFEWEGSLFTLYINPPRVFSFDGSAVTEIN